MNRSNATPVTLSKQNNKTHWNSDAEFQTIRHNMTIDRTFFERRTGRPDSYTICENMTPTTKNETCKWIVEFLWEKSGFGHVYASLAFQLDDDGKAGRAIANVKAALLDDFGREVHSKEDFLEFDAGGEKIRWTNFIDFFNLNRNPLVKKNSFIISIDISYYYSPRRNLTDQQNMISPELNTTKCLLSDNFGSLLRNQDLADVMLLAKGKNYSAHAAVLAARSDVFATVFKNSDHRDKKHKIIRIDVTDIDAEVMDELLRYIYTGKCQTSDELAERLYAAADAYELNELKTVILKSMFERLSVKNALNVLVFADEHHVEDLKSRVIEFIVKNSAQMLNTADWKSIPNVQLATELCQKLLQRLSESVPCESFCKAILAKKLK